MTGLLLELEAIVLIHCVCISGHNDELSILHVVRWGCIFGID